VNPATFRRHQPLNGHSPGCHETHRSAAAFSRRGVTPMHAEPTHSQWCPNPEARHPDREQRPDDLGREGGPAEPRRSVCHARAGSTPPLPTPPRRVCFERKPPAPKARSGVFGSKANTLSLKSRCSPEPGTGHSSALERTRFLGWEPKKETFCRVFDEKPVERNKIVQSYAAR
jgi:hypothetical protein